MDLGRLVPKEHGTWAMLLVPWAIGCGVARRLDGSILVLLVAILAFFLAHAQVMTWARLRLSPASASAETSRAWRRALGLAAVGALAVAPLVIFERRPALIPLGALAAAFGAASLLLVRHRLDRAVPGQILGAVGLPLSAPAAHAVAVGALTPAATQLWALAALFFLGSVVYVGIKIEALRRKTAMASRAARVRLAARLLALDVAILAAAGLALVPGALSPLVLLAFVPTAAQSVIGAARLHRPARLKRVGIIAAGHSILFAVLVILLA